MLTTAPIENRVWTEAEGRAFCDDHGFGMCSVSNGLARKAAQADREAFWNLSHYSAAQFTVAADEANTYGLDASCAALSAKLAGFGKTTGHILDVVGDFLDRLAPANEAGCRARAAAYERWCATFFEEASMVEAA